ncbi:MAG: acyltransferase [Bacteroidales bacterium]|nr:acyltransferase [Bacteroidales bacterium]
MQSAQWDGKTRGGKFGQQCLFFLLRFLNIRVAYALVAVVLPFFLLSRTQHLKAIYRYFRHRHKRSAVGAAISTVANYFVFGQVVIDKFYLLSGSKSPFTIGVDRLDLYAELSKQPAGFMMLSSHIGNYELAGYSLKSHKPMNAIVFGGENAFLQQNRNRSLGNNNITPIAVSPDMSHLFAIKGALERGEVVSIPGDRLFGSTKNVMCPLLGAEAQLPLGPFITAVQLKVKALAIFVMKERGLRYSIYIREIAPTTDGPMRRQAESMAHQFAAEMQTLLLRYPTQWFNYYEFWGTTPKPTTAD